MRALANVSRLCRRCRYDGTRSCCRYRQRRTVRRAATCGDCRKERYANESAAMTGAIEAAQKHGVTHLVYPCPNGDGYHTTSKRYRKAAA